MEPTALWQKAPHRRSFPESSTVKQSANSVKIRNRSLTAVQSTFLEVIHCVGTLVAPIVVAVLTRKLLEQLSWLHPSLSDNLPDEAKHLIPTVAAIAVDRLIVRLAELSEQKDWSISNNEGSSESVSLKSLTSSPSANSSQEAEPAIVDTVNDSTIDRWSRTPAMGQDRVTNEIASSTVSDQISPTIPSNAAATAAASGAAEELPDIEQVARQTNFDVLRELIRTAARNGGPGSGEVFHVLENAIQSALRSNQQQQQQQLLLLLPIEIYCSPLSTVKQCETGGIGACFDTSVTYKVIVQEWDKAILQCAVRNLDREVVTWMKNDGRDIPLTVGTLLFAADKDRMRLNVSQAAGYWDLIIEPVRLSDAGQYLCQVSLRNGGIMAQDYTLIVEESDFKPTGVVKIVSTRQSADNRRLFNDDQDHKNRGRTNGLFISGDSAVFSGTRHFPLTCTVRFSSRDAKATMSAAAAANGGGSPRLGIEWYHRGARLTSEPGAIDISLNWVDSDTVVSVLTIGRVRPDHSGEWVCLKRLPAQLGIDTEVATLTLQVLVRSESSDLASSKVGSSDQRLATAGLGAGIASGSKSNQAQRAAQLDSLGLLIASTVALALAVC